MASDGPLSPQTRHDLRNHLQAIAFGIRLLKEELEAGDRDSAALTFQDLQEHLQYLDAHPTLQPPRGE